MAELHLYFIRHGETPANVDHSLYSKIPDHAFRLTPKGIEQAQKAGMFLTDHLKERQEKENSADFGKMRVWYSPYYRTRETAYYILDQMGSMFDPSSDIISYRENYHLFEQRMGLFDNADNDGFEEKFPTEHSDYKMKVRDCGHVYAQAPLGESRIDTVIRVRPFFGTIMRDAKTHNIRNVIVVSHGVTIRSLTMGWMQYPPEWSNAEKNPVNGSIRYIHGSRSKGYIDEGYIFGKGAPLHDPMATQKKREGAENIYMLMPQRPNIIVPPGVNVVDPFARHRNP
jgi:2,3-bisphosphoglycerate-dependent phosphoglycerate mutase